MGISTATRAQVQSLFSSLHQTSVALRQVADGTGSATSPGRFGASGIDTLLTAVAVACGAVSIQLPDAGRAYGDSITQGTGDSTLRWPILRSTATGRTYTNNGIGGTVMQNRADASGNPRADNGRARATSTLLGANLVRYYELLYGLNDLRYTGAPATMNLTNFIIDYTWVIDALIGAGVAPSNITIGSPTWITDTAYTTGSAGFTGSNRTVHEQYVAALYLLAFQKGCKYAATYEAIRDGGGASLLGADGIHLNNSGQTAVATAFGAAAVPSTGTWSGASAPVPAPPPPAPVPPAPAPSPTAPVTVLEATTSPAMTGNSTSEVYTSNPTGGIARVGSFVVGTEAVLEIQHPNITDSGAVLAFDVQSGLPSTTNTQDYVAQIIPSGAVYAAANAVSALVVPNFTLAAAPTARLRLRMAGTGVTTIETQNDDASSWVVRHTFGVTATAGSTYHVRMYCTWSASQRRIYQPRVSGITLT